MTIAGFAAPFLKLAALGIGVPIAGVLILACLTLMWALGRGRF